MAYGMGAKKQPVIVPTFRNIRVLCNRSATVRSIFGAYRKILRRRLDTLLKHFRFEAQMSVGEAVRLAKQETEKQNEIEIEFNAKK